MRLATWNLERVSPRAWRRAPAQQRRIAAVDADVWVFTETFTTRSPGDEYRGVFSPAYPQRRPDPDERWTAIWSRWPITVLDEPAPHRRGTVAARIDSPTGPLIVYGTVIAYHGERHHDDGREAQGWEVHRTEIDRQGAEWRRLRAENPGVPIVVAGDLNQGRSGRRSEYGNTAVRQALTDAFDAAGLRCVTEIDLVATGQITERSHVQHIAVSDSIGVVGPVLAWDRVDDTGYRLSDHPTVAVEIDVSPPS